MWKFQIHARNHGANSIQLSGTNEHTRGKNALTMCRRKNDAVGFFGAKINRT
jgi:hypothetical protein